MEKHLRRPNSLPLRSSLRDFNAFGQGTRFPGPPWMELLPEVSTRRLLAIVRRHGASWGLPKSRYPPILLFCVVFVLLMILKIPRQQQFVVRSRRCTAEEEVYRNGRVLCGIRGKRVKYLSYQPPGGGWNNQRIAFENAVIIAKLLNRALIVHPMAPHREILRAKQRRVKPSGYEIYNSIPEQNLLPLSKVIDLRQLSRLLTVKEVTTGHPKFLDDYRHLSWYRVCHNGLVGVWVDALPPAAKSHTWTALRDHASKGLAPSADLPLYRRSCKPDLEKYSNNNTTFPFWGILDELSDRQEDIIYFEEGSMYFREMIFLDKNRVLDAHRWVINYINFAAGIRRHVEFNLRRIGYRFSCVHVRRSDHPSARSVTQKLWLDLLEKRKILNSTEKLYIATDEEDTSWFDLFREAGFHLLFSRDLVSPKGTQGNSSSSSGIFDQDLLGLSEQLLCTHAQYFVGSYYSTFSLYIKRLRMQKRWMGKLLLKPLFGVTWLDTSQDK